VKHLVTLVAALALSLGVLGLHSAGSAPVQADDPYDFCVMHRGPAACAGVPGGPPPTPAPPVQTPYEFCVQHRGAWACNGVPGQPTPPPTPVASPTAPPCIRIVCF
jgi:hypothetical protein